MGKIINMEKLSRLTVQIRKDQHKKLKDKAGPGVSISYLVRHAIDSTDIAPFSRVSFEQSSYAEYESNSIDGLKKIHALITLKKYDVITDDEYLNIRKRLD